MRRATLDIQVILSEQALAAREVAETVEGIALLAESNSAQASQTLVSSHKIQQTTLTLQQLCNQFKVHPN